MATLQEIQDFLDIEIGDKRLRPGKKYKNKNKYYYYEDQYYIVMLTKGKWMIAEDCKKTRRLLRVFCWHHNDGYVRNSPGKRFWHQQFLNYENQLVCDHINNSKFDNRFDNLRIVTQEANMRNKLKYSNNTSGKQGICRDKTKNGYQYWRARIFDNNKEMSKRFSIDKYGEEEAKQLAIEWRTQKEQEFGYIGD